MLSCLPGLLVGNRATTRLEDEKQLLLQIINKEKNVFLTLECSHLSGSKAKSMCIIIPDIELANIVLILQICRFLAFEQDS